MPRLIFPIPHAVYDNKSFLFHFSVILPIELALIVIFIALEIFDYTANEMEAFGKQKKPDLQTIRQTYRLL